MKCITKNLYIQSPNGKRIKSKQLQNNIPTTYLSVTSQVNGEQSAQTNILYEKSRRMSRNLCCSYLSHYNEQTNIPTMCEQPNYIISTSGIIYV